MILSTNPTGPFAPNSIIQADLVVRVKDWHPVAEILRVQGHEEVRDYELTETDFDLLALNSLSPGIFAEITPPSTRAIPQIAMPPQVVAPAATELIAAEIMVRYALHRAKACLGEPIEILTTDLGGIEVRGLAETPERKEELIAALTKHTTGHSKDSESRRSPSDDDTCQDFHELQSGTERKHVWRSFSGYCARQQASNSG